MKLNRYGMGALVGSIAVFVGAGAALADDGATPATKCDARLAKVAEKRGVSVQQLSAEIQARLLARIDAAEKAGRISPERAAALRQRVAGGNVCHAIAKHRPVRIAARGMLHAAAGFLGLDREQLRAQLPGTSLAALAAKQGKSTHDLEAAMLAPATERLSKAVASGKLSQERANMALERLQKLADALANKVFPAK